MFLAGVAIVQIVPLFMAGLLPRWSVSATIITLASNAAATFGEPFVMKSIIGNAPGPELGHMIAINGIAAICVLLFIAAIRLGGYRLTRTAFAAAESRAAEARQPGR